MSIAIPAPDVWLVHYDPGPAWLPGKPVFEQPLEGHAEFNEQRIADGTLIVSGPLIGRDGGFALYRGPDQATVIDLLAEDPAVCSGVFVVTVTGVLISFSSVAELPPLSSPADRAR
jgi:uncharacterized protein YciI